MIELKNVQWGQIRLADIFDEIPRGKVSDLKNVADGKTIIIAASGANEGFSCFSNDEPISKNAMTISFNGVGTGTAFVHNYLFNLNSDCGLVKPKENISLYALRFIAVSINQNKNKFNYGYKANESRILRQTVLLPISDDGQPDYTFMEMFIKEREAQKRKEYLDYCKEQLKIIGGGYNLIPLADKQWKAFFIGGDNGLFEIYSGKRLTVANMTEGECPFIGATDSNNGITNWVGNRNETYDSNVLGVNYNGSVVENFYHPYHCIFSDDVKRLHLKECEDNKFALLFFSRLILMQKAKYTYGYKFNGTRMNRQKILVPITDSGEPDYEYMEKYSRNLLRDKIQRYIDYAAN